MSARLRKARAALLIATIPGLAGILFAHWGPTENLERFGLDRLFEMRGVRPEPAGVRVVALDDDSYGELGIDPTKAWPRHLHAELIRALSKEGAAAVGFDVLFEKAGDPAQDDALETAIAQAGNVVLGATVERVDDPRFRQARVIDPFAPFAAAAAALGWVNLPPDQDGVIRSAWLTHKERPALSLATYEVATGDRSHRTEPGRFIDYYGPARSLRTVSFYQALDPEQYLPPGFFRGKIVFVGLSQAAAVGPTPKDAFLTPFRGKDGIATFGVEIHATLAANLLEGRRFDLLPQMVEAVLLLVLALVAAVIFIYVRPLMGAAVFVLLEILPWVTGHLAFTQGHLWVPVMIPAAVQLPAAYALSLIWYYLTTVREREKVKRAFAFYLSPEMIKKIADDPSSLNLGGEEIVATALFTDIKGFSPIAEKLTAPQTAALLNEYFSESTRHVFEEGGTLIKYIGDAVFAIWGAPIHMEDHATPACRAALALARAQEAPRADAGAVGKLVTRIGVHTGPMLVGNLGSSQRFDYTAIGDAVNLASRLEGLNKQLGTRALVSGETLALTDGSLAVRPLGRARVVGRNEPVEIHELLGLRGEETLLPETALACFRQALDAFSARRFEEAREGFRTARAMCGGHDGPSEFYLHTIECYLVDPPPDGWDGVVTFESK